MLKSFLNSIVFLILLSSGETKNGRQKVFPKNLCKIIGEWQLEGSNTFEIWEDQDSLFLGKVVKIENKDTILMEKLRIVKIAKDIYFEATVISQNKQRPILFKLKQQDKNEFVFVNQKHDFPKQIVYNLRTKNVISASISGNDKYISFKYIKIE